MVYCVAITCTKRLSVALSERLGCEWLNGAVCEYYAGCWGSALYCVSVEVQHCGGADAADKGPWQFQNQHVAVQKMLSGIILTL